MSGFIFMVSGAAMTICIALVAYFPTYDFCGWWVNFVHYSHDAVDIQCDQIFVAFSSHSRHRRRHHRSRSRSRSISKSSSSSYKSRSRSKSRSASVSRSKSRSKSSSPSRSKSRSSSLSSSSLSRDSRSTSKKSIALSSGSSSSKSSPVKDNSALPSPPKRRYYDKAKEAVSSEQSRSESEDNSDASSANHIKYATKYWLDILVIYKFSQVAWVRNK